jgi:hypothetical protein
LGPFVAALIAGMSAPAFAAPPVTAATPACSDGSRGGATISLGDAFAHAIDDAPTLRFLARLTEMDAAGQRDVIERVTKLGIPAATGPADAETGCLTELGYRTIRGLTLLANLWNVGEGAPAFALLTRRLEMALVSLDSDAALAPFGLRASDLSAERPASSCDSPHRDARTVRVHHPTYPLVARAGRTTGSILVRIALNREGFVRTATVLRSSAGERPGAQSLADESVLSAAATTYDPEVVACKAIAGTYISERTTAALSNANQTFR